MKNTKKTAYGLILTALAVILALSMFSCAGGSTADNGEYGSEPGASGGTSGDGGFGSSYDKSEVENGDLFSEDRKIIKNVNEGLQTDAYDDLIEAIESAVSENKGYISNRNEYGENYYNKEKLRSCDLVIRIPAENLDKFTSAISEMAVVTRYSENVVDVTEAYVDIEARLAVLRAEEAALSQMLSEASDVETLLKIRERLLSAQSDIASLEARKKSYDSRIEYSTVNLSVSEVRRAEAADPTFFEEVGGRFSDSLYGIGQGFRAFGVWILGDFLYIVIYLAIAAAVLLLAIAVIRRIKKRK